jgi:glutamine amidotransferase
MPSASSIAIIDYQMGNLRSVQKALEHVGGSAFVTNHPDEILAAEKVVLPGVGAFGDAMRELENRQLGSIVQRVIDSDRPFLGICLGLQLLFEVGEESGIHRGLGVLKGKVVRFMLPGQFKVPHMGWNQVASRQPDCPLTAGSTEANYFYFVHSYVCQPADPSVVWLESDYGGPFCAAVRRGNLFATQFHPEKSQANGLRLLKDFVDL